MDLTINTNRQSVNRHSDFTLRMSLLKDGEPYTPTSFVMAFYVDEWDCETVYTASLIGGEFINCSISGDVISVYFDHPHFPLGTLKCRVVDKVRDINFKDGTFDTVTPITLPVEIVTGGGTDSVDVGDVTIEGSVGYMPPVGGIPKADLSLDVQASLGKADTALQSADKSELQTAITSLQNALNTLIGSGNVQGAIDTFNEVVAFLNGISSSDTLAAKLAQIATDIAAKANDDAVVKTVSVNGGTPQSPVNGNVDISAPTKTSDLINDRGFVTAESLDGIVAGSADFVMTEDDDYIYINPVIPTLSVVGAVVASENTKSGTFKVSGTNLKGDVTVAITAANWSLSANGSSGQSLTLHPEGGVLAETTITATYSGSSDSTANTITVSSQGAASVSTSASYTVYAGPTIIAETSASISAVGGASKSVDIVVAGANLTGDITATLNDSTGKFSISPASISQSGGAASGTLHITYSPSAGDTGTHSASVVLSSAGATSVTINITGTVLVQSLSISPTLIELQSASGTSVSGTINVIGENLTSDVSLSVGSGFSVSPSTISYADVNNAGQTGVEVTVTADTTASSGTLTASDGTHSASVSLEWTEAEAQPSVGDVVTKGGINYKVTSLPSGGVNGTLTIANGDGDILTNYRGATNKYTMSSLVIPSTVEIANETYDVTEISLGAFGDCTAIKTISFAHGSKLTTIGEFAFNKCTGNTMVSIVIPATVLKVGRGAFGGTKIQSYTFLSDISLNIGNMLAGISLESDTKYVDFEEGMSSLGNCIGNMKSLTTLVLRRTADIVSCSFNLSAWSTFYARNQQKTSDGESYTPTIVYVPSSLKSTYEANSAWSAWLSAGVITLDTIENLNS